MAFNNSMCSYFNKSRQSGSNYSYCKHERWKGNKKPNINALIKWGIQCRWIKEFTTYSYGNEFYYSKK